jgi:murein DD-endopeptidase MepM/ murein hydrolase activator NlpD
MTNSGAVASFGWLRALRDVFKPRDIFLHDGTNLRRFRLGARLQMAAVIAAFLLVVWSAVATVSAVAAMNGDVARMQRRVAQMESDLQTVRNAAQQRAALLERRQAFLAAVMSGDADARQLAALLPPQASLPDDAAVQAAAAPFAEVEDMQAAMAAQARAATRRRYFEAAQAVRRVGLDPARFHRAAAGVGGPYEPMPASGNADPDYRALFMSWRRLDQLEQGVASIPSGQPVASFNFTSGFGGRADPFHRGAAFHPGVDLAAPMGTPIYATADGIVSRSEYNNGGYGNMVEINHGQGISTRYGHMSRRIAQVGQRVHRGELIGLMGSTGRSTGSHVHYEVRIDGQAVNPVPFLETGTTLVALQRRLENQPAAIGGPTAGSR